jgi:hypothetical protein
MRSTILAAAFVSAFAQSGAQPFAGTWTAALAGQTYAQLELKVTGGSIGGQIRLGAIHFGREGTVEAVVQTAQDSTPTPIFDVTLRNDVLSFARKDKDEIDRFEMQLVNGDGRLTILLSADDRAELASQGVSTMQPLTLKRVAP